jgi:hypothetical protein
MANLRLPTKLLVPLHIPTTAHSIQSPFSLQSSKVFLEE